MSAQPQITRQSPVVWVAAAVLGIVSIVWAGRAGFEAIDFSDVSLSQMGQLLSAYLVIALLVERAVELILNWRFGQDEIAIRAPLREAVAGYEAKVRMLSRERELLPEPKLRAGLAADDLLPGGTALREALPAQAAVTRERLERLRRHKQRWATLCSVGLSAGLALSGFRMLHGGFAEQIATSGLPTIQARLFAHVDIFLTTTVLAGGAEGIHHIIDNLSNFGRSSESDFLTE